jgi:hypothetical protein
MADLRRRLRSLSGARVGGPRWGWFTLSEEVEFGKTADESSDLPGMYEWR